MVNGIFSPYDDDDDDFMSDDENFFFVWIFSVGIFLFCIFSFSRFSWLKLKKWKFFFTFVVEFLENSNRSNWIPFRWCKKFYSTLWRLVVAFIHWFIFERKNFLEIFHVSHENFYQSLTKDNSIQLDFFLSFFFPSSDRTIDRSIDRSIDLSVIHPLRKWWKKNIVVIRATTTTKHIFFFS